MNAVVVVVFVAMLVVAAVVDAAARFSQLEDLATVAVVLLGHCFLLSESRQLL